MDVPVAGKDHVHLHGVPLFLIDADGLRSDLTIDPSGRIDCVGQVGLNRLFGMLRIRILRLDLNNSLAVLFY